MVLVAIVGMAGSGKTEAAAELSKAGFERIYFGGFVVDEVKRRGLPLIQEHEKKVRMELREKNGMAAIALLSIPKIKELLEQGKNVFIEDLYSWEELLELQKAFDRVIVVALFASPVVRYKRLTSRSVRPLNFAEARARDITELETLQKGPPIAMADYTIINEGTKKEFEKELKLLIKKILKENPC
jgi:dephospho-CoA kinase